MLNDDLTRLTCDAIATRSESSLPMGPCISLTCAVPSVSSKRQRALGGRTRLRDGARQGAQSQRVTPDCAHNSPLYRMAILPI